MDSIGRFGLRSDFLGVELRVLEQVEELRAHVFRWRNSLGRHPQRLETVGACPDEDLTSLFPCGIGIGKWTSAVLDQETLAACRSGERSVAHLFQGPQQWR